MTTPHAETLNRDSKKIADAAANILGEWIISQDLLGEAIIQAMQNEGWDMTGDYPYEVLNEAAQRISLVAA